MRHFITLIVFALLSAVATAQPPQGAGHRGGGDISNNKKFVEFQCRQIVTILKLEGERESKFREIYAEYAEASKAEQEPTPPPHHAAQSPANRAEASSQDREQPRGLYRHNGNQSDEDIEAGILESFARSKRAIELKEMYYKRFREILSPREISTIYEVERRTLERMTTEMQRRAGGGGGTNSTPPRHSEN